MAASNVKVMSGNEAVAYGAMAAGLGFFAGYPITPSSEIAEELSALLPQSGGRFIQMEDEISAMGAVIGASLAGAKALTATSGPGFSLKQENIGFACIAEVPCVIVNVMRGGPSTGMPTMPAQGDVMQARWGTHGDHPIIVLSPNSVRESYDLTVRAFNLSEKLRIPVILLMDEIIAHVNEKVTLPERVEVLDRKKPDAAPGTFKPFQHTDDMVPPMAAYGDGHRFHVTGLHHDETGFPTNSPKEIERLNLRLNGKLVRYRAEIVEVAREQCDDAEIGVLAYGATARAAAHAVREARAKGIKVGLLRPRTLWPLADREIRAFAEQVKTIIVPEMNFGQYAHEVEWAAAGACAVAPLTRVDGQPISPGQLLEAIERAARG